MSDVGLQALEALHKDMLIDEPWTERKSRGFAWIGSRLRQEFHASPAYDEDGILLSRVTATVPVVDGVTRDRGHVERVLASINRFAVGSFYYFDADRSVVVSAFYGRVHAETVQWRTRQISLFAACQLALAESEGDFIAELVGGEIAARAHQESGERDQPDDMLNVLDLEVAPRGEGESMFANAFDFETIAEIAGRMNVATLGGSGSGIALETPFGSSTALTLMKADWIHPRLGAGLAVQLHLPSELDGDGIAAMSAMLNRRELANEFPYQGLGAWGNTKHVSGQWFVGHTRFMPNMVHTPGAALDAFYGAVNRARWANQILNPGTEEVDAWQLLKERYGASSSEEDKEE